MSKKKAEMLRDAYWVRKMHKAEPDMPLFEAGADGETPEEEEDLTRTGG